MLFNPIFQQYIDSMLKLVKVIAIMMRFTESLNMVCQETVKIVYGQHICESEINPTIKYKNKIK